MSLSPTWKRRRLARLLDHSVLSPVHTEQDVFKGCRIVREYGVRSIIVKPAYVRLAARLLAGTPARIGSVIGFPHGGETARMKACARATSGSSRTRSRRSSGQRAAGSSR